MNKIELSDAGATNLVCAIVEVAVRDWRHSRKKLKKNPGSLDADRCVKECERFFRSRYFENLTGMNGKEFLARLKGQEERRCGK